MSKLGRRSLRWTIGTETETVRVRSGAIDSKRSSDSTFDPWSDSTDLAAAIKYMKDEAERIGTERGYGRCTTKRDNP
jgi:hypothetical protein